MLKGISVYVYNLNKNSYFLIQKNLWKKILWLNKNLEIYHQVGQRPQSLFSILIFNLYFDFQNKFEFSLNKNSEYLKKHEFES